MDPLPVPPLDQTLQRYLVAVEPLLSPQENEQARDAVIRTLEGVGPACQADLEAFATSEAAAGRSWLSAEWLRGYLDVRTPLPLTSSVGFQVRLPPHDPEPAHRPVAQGTATGGAAAGEGVEKAAAAVRQLAGVHLAWLRGDLPREQTPRGEPVCGAQREVLGGGVRHPGTSSDEFRPADLGARRREVGLLVDDWFFVAPVSDTQGHPLPARTLARSLQEALAWVAHREGHAEPGFTAVSCLGSAQASDYLDRLLVHPANQRVYERLSEALFVVNLVDRAASAQEHLLRTAFGPGQAWAYTPITYQIGLQDDFVGMHLEHSQVDAATLKAVLAHVTSEAEAPDARHDDPDRPTGSLEPLGWTYPDGLAAQVDLQVSSYRARADQMQVDVASVPRPVPDDLTLRVSNDALCQWMMLYAQLATYGQARSTYEAVDTRHFIAGRTECLRSVTPQAVRLVRALLEGAAEPSHLHEALGAHKEWIKACKTGQGIDRHLTGLAMVARTRGQSLPVLDDPSYRKLKTDFLSTSSIGDHDQIVAMCFAPTSEGGLGVNYTALPDRYEFVVTSQRTQRPQVQTFLAQLTQAADALATLLATMALGEQDDPANRADSSSAAG